MVSNKQNCNEIVNCKLILAYINVTTNLIDHLINYSSIHLSNAFEIPYNNICIYITKLHSSRSFFKLVACILEYFIQSYLSNEFVYKGLVCLAIISIFRFILLIFLYFKSYVPSFIYIILIIESFFTSFFKTTLYTTIPEYTSVLMISSDISSISIFVFQMAIKCFIKKPLSIIITHCWICFLITTASSGALYYFIEFFQFSSLNSEDRDETETLISILDFNEDDLESELKEADTHSKSITKINKLKIMKKHLTSLSKSVSNIKILKQIGKLEELENLLNQMPEPNKIQLYIDTFTMKIKIDQISKIIIISDKQKLECLNMNLLILLNDVKLNYIKIRQIQKIYSIESTTYSSEINSIISILDKIISLKNFLQKLIEKSDIKKLEEKINDLNLTLNEIYSSKGEKGINKLTDLNKKLEEIKDISKEIENANQMVHQIIVILNTNSIQQQIQTIEENIQREKKNLKDNIIINENENITLNQNKSKTIEDLTSNEIKLKAKPELQLIKDVDKNIKQFSQEISKLKEILIHLKKVYEIPELLNYFIQMKDKEWQISKIKKDILDGFVKAGIIVLPTIKQSDIVNINSDFQKLRLAIESFVSKKKKLEEGLKIIDQQNPKLKGILETIGKSIDNNEMKKLIQQNPLGIRSQLLIAENSLVEVNFLGPFSMLKQITQITNDLRSLNRNITSSNKISIISNLNSIEKNYKILTTNFEKSRQISTTLDNKGNIIERLDVINKNIKIIGENGVIEKLIKLKDDLDPRNVDLNGILDNLNHIQYIKKFIDLTKGIQTQFKTLKSLQDEPKLNLFWDEINSLVNRLNQTDISLIGNLSEEERDINELYSKYNQPVNKTEELIKLEQEIKKYEKEIPQEIKNLGLLKGSTYSNNKLVSELDKFRTRLEKDILSSGTGIKSLLPDLKRAYENLPTILDEIKTKSISKADTKDSQLDNAVSLFDRVFPYLSILDFIDTNILTVIDRIKSAISKISSYIKSYKSSNVINQPPDIKIEASKINIQDVEHIYNTISLLSVEEISNKINDAKEVIRKLEKENDLEGLIKMKDVLQPGKLDLEKHLKYIIKTEGEKDILNNITKTKDQLLTLKSLPERKIKLDKEIEKYIENEKEAKYKTITEITKKEKKQLEELKSVKHLIEQIKESKKLEITKNSQTIKQIINEIKDKINDFRILDHILNVISPFMMGVATSSITNFTYPGILPLAIVEIDSCETINLYIPLFLIIGSVTIFTIDMFVDEFKQWHWYFNIIWLLIIPQILIMIFSFLAIHCKSKCSKQIATSKSRIFIMLSILLICYSLTESTSYVAIANYVFYKSKYFKNSVNVIRYYLISISFVNFFIYKLSVGYNVLRVKHNYITPNFQPYEINNKHNCCFWFLNILLRAIIDIFLDFRLNIRDYT